MFRFTAFESLGLTIAAMSEVEDGDGGPEHVSTMAESLGASPDRLVGTNQVHGTRVVAVPPLPPALEADGLITSASGTALIIRVADCVPILLFDPTSQTVGLIHAGWRGTLGGIATNAVEAMLGHGAGPLKELQAIIGPSAGPCCYEVGANLRKLFRQKDLSVSGECVDLWESNVRQLKRAGIPLNNIVVSNICTLCTSQFHSFRRDSTSSRNAVIVMI